MAICHVRAKSSRNGPTLDTNDIARVTRDSPADRRAATRQEFSPVLIVITALAAAGVLIYARFLLDPGNRGDLLPWLVVIAAEGVLVVHALFAMWTMLSATRDPRSYHYWATQERLLRPRRSSSGARSGRARGRRRGLRHRVRRAGRGRASHARGGARHPRGAPHLAAGRRELRRDAGAGRRAGLLLPAPAGQRRRQGRQHQPRAHPGEGRLLRASSTPTSCRVRSSSRRCCPSSPTTTWRSCRPRRPTATCTP